MHVYDVAVIGGGASGALVVAHLLARTEVSIRVVVIERNDRLWRGVAFGTLEPSHLLNVPSAGMSAWSFAPDHFERWLDSSGISARPSAFVPRMLYGDYLDRVVEDARREASTRGASLEVVRAEAIGLVGRSDGWRVVLRDHDAIAARTVVVATGQGAPTPIASITTEIHPWSPAATEGIAPNDTVLLIGTGLTAVDVALSLKARGHRGVVYAISRHGLLPRVHRINDAAKPLPLPRGSTVRALFSALRSRSTPDGWRGVFDALRPETSELWKSLPDRERVRFLRHLRAYWDVHRHRMPPAAGDAIALLRRRGQLIVIAARLASLAEGPNGVVVHLRERNGGTRILTVRRLVNCTGPAPLASSFVEGLLSSGIARADSLGLGLDSLPDGSVRDKAGNVSGRLFTIGPLRRGELWESTAIPEIRIQAEALAARLAGIAETRPSVCRCQSL